MATATAEMSLPDKKPEHESGYYEGSDQEGSMECGCPSPVSSRNSSHSTKLKRRHSAQKHKKVPPKKARTEPPVNGCSLNINGHIDKSVEIVECSSTSVSSVKDYKKPEELMPVPGPSSKRSSSVELIGGTVPAPARDSVDWNLVDASKIRKRCKGKPYNIFWIVFTVSGCPNRQNLKLGQTLDSSSFFVTTFSNCYKLFSQ